MHLICRMQDLEGGTLKLQLEAKLDFFEHLEWHCAAVLVPLPFLVREKVFWLFQTPISSVRFQ